MSDFDIDNLADRIHAVGNYKGWDKNWSQGGCYIHLEVSEFIEALRGKGDDSPQEEAADVIITLFAVLANYNIDPSEVLQNVESKIFQMEEGIDKDIVLKRKERKELLKEIQDPTPEKIKEWAKKECPEDWKALYNETMNNSEETK